MPLIDRVDDVTCCVGRSRLAAGSAGPRRTSATWQSTATARTTTVPTTCSLSTGGPATGGGATATTASVHRGLVSVTGCTDPEQWRRTATALTRTPGGPTTPSAGGRPRTTTSPASHSECARAQHFHRPTRSL